jgi:hypothetical protein
LVINSLHILIFANSDGILGAVDSSVVADVNKISWNEVVEFAPIGNENNVSSYYQWAVPQEAISVCCASYYFVYSES